MNKKYRHQRRRKPGLSSRQTLSRYSPWPWLAGIAVLLLIGGGSLMVWNSDNSQPTVTPQIIGSPRLTVDQTIVDEGYIQFNVPVQTTFRLSNIGDQPLNILGEPQVELVEGC